MFISLTNILICFLLFYHVKFCDPPPSPPHRHARSVAWGSWAVSHGLQQLMIQRPWVSHFVCLLEQKLKNRFHWPNNYRLHCKVLFNVKGHTTRITAMNHRTTYRIGAAPVAQQNNNVQWCHACHTFILLVQTFLQRQYLYHVEYQVMPSSHIHFHCQ